jgi:hypothetical protein
MPVYYLAEQVQKNQAEYIARLSTLAPAAMEQRVCLTSYYEKVEADLAQVLDVLVPRKIVVMQVSMTLGSGCFKTIDHV